MADSKKSSNFNTFKVSGSYMAYLPNAITLGRICLSVIILASLVFEKYRLAFYLFILAGLSDGLDGFLARKYDWFSRFGSIADPLADKILLLSSLIALAYGGHIPIWLVGLIIARDIWVISGALAYHYLIALYELSPTTLSKTNTFLQLVLVFLVLFNLSFIAVPALWIQIAIYLVCLANIASWLDYTWVWGRRAIQVVTIRRTERRRAE
jgi:cardiolipin synthase (CMP-forming)